MTHTSLTPDSSVSLLARISPLHEEGLQKLHLLTIRDILYHFPTRYADMREVVGTSTLTPGQSVTIYGICLLYTSDAADE